jgi:hypothetical protein
MTLWLQFCGSGSRFLTLNPDPDVSDQIRMDPDAFKDRDLRRKNLLSYIYFFADFKLTVLKEQCHKIFDLRCFSSNNSSWARDSLAKTFLNSTSYSQRNLTFKLPIFVHAVSMTPH